MYPKLVRLIIIFSLLLWASAKIWGQAFDPKAKDYPPGVIQEIERYYRIADGYAEDVPDSAIFYCKKVKAIATYYQDTFQLLSNHLILSKIYLKSNQATNAIIELETYISQAKKLNLAVDPFLYIELGNIYYKLNLVRIAKENYLKAIASKNFTRWAYPVGVNNIGMCLRAEGNYEAAEEHFRRAFYYRRDVLKDTALAIYSLKLLAENYYKSKQLNKAKESILEALELYQKPCCNSHNDKSKYLSFQPEIWMQLIPIYRIEGKTDSMEICYQQVKAVVNTYKYWHVGLLLDLKAAKEWIELKNIQKAEICLASFNANTHVKKSLEEQREYSKYRQSLSLLKGNKMEALYYENQWLRYQDSIQTLLSTNQIVSFINDVLEGQKELLTKKQKNEIIQGETLLEQEKQLRQSMTLLLLLIGMGAVVTFYFYKKSEKDKVIITKQNSEKEMLIREIHHRVKNNLTVISGMLDLQEDYLHNEEMQAILRDAKSRVSSMALVHQNLYQQEDIGNIDSQAYFENLYKSVYQSYKPKGVSLIVELDCRDVQMNIDTLIPLALISNELLTNTFKYAFKNKSQGTIKIQLLKTEKEYQFNYSDDGIGMSLTDENKPSGLGSMLIAGLCQQLKGVFEKVSNQHGLSYQFKFQGLNKN